MHLTSVHLKACFSLEIMIVIRSKLPDSGFWSHMILFSQKADGQKEICLSAYIRLYLPFPTDQPFRVNNSIAAAWNCWRAWRTNLNQFHICSLTIRFAFAPFE